MFYVHNADKKIFVCQAYLKFFEKKNKLFHFQYQNLKYSEKAV